MLWCRRGPERDLRQTCFEKVPNQHRSIFLGLLGNSLTVWKHNIYMTRYGRSGAHTTIYLFTRTQSNMSIQWEFQFLPAGWTKSKSYSRSPFSSVLFSTDSWEKSWLLKLPHAHLCSMYSLTLTIWCWAGSGQSLHWSFFNSNSHLKTFKCSAE